MGKAAREFIAIGPKASFTWPIPANFVPERAELDAGDTLVSSPVRIDHHNFASTEGVGFTVIAVDDGGNPLDCEIKYQILLSSDGISGTDGGYANAVWGPLQTIHAAGVLAANVTQFDANIAPTQAIRIQIENTGAVDANPSAPTVALPNGTGVHIRVRVTS